MKMEDQLCTIEQAQIMHALGMAQIGLWFWQDMNDDDLYCRQRLMSRDDAFHPMSLSVIREQHSAFTVAELGQMLPGKFRYDKQMCFVDSRKYLSTGGSWVCSVYWFNVAGKQMTKKMCIGTTEAQVRADMFIHLVSQNYISIEEVNKRMEKE